MSPRPLVGIWAHGRKSAYLILGFVPCTMSRISTRRLAHLITRGWVTEKPRCSCTRLWLERLNDGIKARRAVVTFIESQDTDRSTRLDGAGKRALGCGKDLSLTLRWVWESTRCLDGKIHSKILTGWKMYTKRERGGQFEIRTWFPVPCNHRENLRVDHWWQVFALQLTDV